MLLRTQDAPFKEGFNNEYITDNITYQKWLLAK